jgi:SWIM zinc finger
LTASSPALTADAVLALAPDASSAAAARKLTTPGKWPTLSRRDGLVWGECQGSGSQPYLVGVDLRTPDLASKCSCPSRKFPCKHALALLLLDVANQGDWKTYTAPEALDKWLEGRSTRAEAATQPPKESKAPDPAAQARRQAAREGKVWRGLADLHLWMQDLVRTGLASARSQPYGEWSRQAARLIDAQAPGAARLVEQIPDYLHEESGEALLTHLGKLALLCRAWENRAELREGERADLDAALGQPLDLAALKAGEGQMQTWQVVGAAQSSEGRLNVRRTWLQQSAGGSLAALFEYAPQNQSLPPALPPHHRLEADLRFSPGAFAQRAVLAAEPHDIGPADYWLPGTVAQLHAEYAAALGRNPWLERSGHWLGPAWLLPEHVQLRDEHGHAVPIRLESDQMWQWLGDSATRPAYFFGEWDGAVFAPLSMLCSPEAS